MKPQLEVVRTSRPTRISYLDNLRVFLTLLVVAHHSAAPYNNLDVWPKWQQTAPSSAAGPLDLLLMVDQTFFMGFFFLLSGYFAPGAVDRRGPGEFAVERLKRLGIPFLAGTSRFRRYLADNAFAVYLVHAPVIVGAEAALLRLDAAPVPKSLLALVIAAAGSWAIAGALRRVPAVRATV